MGTQMNSYSTVVQSKYYFLALIVVVIASLLIAVFGIRYLTLERGNNVDNTLRTHQVYWSNETVLDKEFVEPETPSCKNGYEEVKTVEGVLFRDRDPREIEVDFELNYPSEIYLEGLIKEGHPEDGCSDNEEGCTESQSHEEFEITIDGEKVFEYQDQGADRNKWFDSGEIEMESSWNEGGHTINFSHLLKGDTAESVDFKFVLCAKPTKESTPTRPIATGNPRERISIIPSIQPGNDIIITTIPTASTIVNPGDATDSEDILVANANSSRTSSNTTLANTGQPIYPLVIVLGIITIGGLGYLIVKHAGLRR